MRLVIHSGTEHRETQMAPLEQIANDVDEEREVLGGMRLVAFTMLALMVMIVACVVFSVRGCGVSGKERAGYGHAVK